MSVYKVRKRSIFTFEVEGDEKRGRNVGDLTRLSKTSNTKRRERKGEIRRADGWEIRSRKERSGRKTRRSGRARGK